ncbi:MAG: C2H2-type zinc finger protein [Nitrospira sp.]|nr:C2H2-type zinc finger protein [Nitrospira sp.]
MLTHIPKADLLGENELAKNNRNPPSTQWSQLDEGESDFIDEHSSSERTISIQPLPPEDNVEENNNVVDLSKANEEPVVSPTQSGGSSEYWCTECNHGFGSESELQRHIVSRHEQNGPSTVTLTEDSYDEAPYNYVMHDDDDESVMSHYSFSSDQRSPTPTSGSRKTPNKRKSNGHVERYNVDLPKRSRSHEKGNEMKMITLVSSSVSPYSDNDESRDSAQELMTSLCDKTADNSLRQVQKIHARFGIEPSSATHGNKPKNGASVGAIAEALQESIKSRSGLKTKTSPIMSATLQGMKLRIKRDSENEVKTGHSSRLELEAGADDSYQSMDSPSDLSLGENGASYSKTSVLGMDTEFSSNAARGSPTTINLKIRNPGFEKVITPQVLFNTKAPFTCEICEETFSDFDGFDTHGVKVHRRFLCSYCGKAFTSRPNRERHVRYHTGEKPYTCDLCPASFFRGDDLKYHRTTKHADVKPFLCGACQTSFSFPKELEKHLRLNPDHKLV